MLKRGAIFLVLLSLILGSAYSYASGKEPSPDSAELKKHDQAWGDMIKSFGLYLAFFNDSYPAGNFTVSQHADSYEEAMAYFSQGFDEELAAEITAAYTFYNPDNDKLQILPTDGLPVLLPENPNLIRTQFIDDDHVIFERYFENYYGENTRYLYRVFCKYDGFKWRIYQLEWEAAQ